MSAGWEARLLPVRGPDTRGATGWCLEIHDLVLSKYAAGRDKDHDFIAGTIAHRMVDRAELERRLGDLPVTPEHRARIADRIRADFDG